MIPPGTHWRECPSKNRSRRIPCVKGGDVTALWKLGIQAAKHFGEPPGHRVGHPRRQALPPAIAPHHHARRSRSLRRTLKRHPRRTPRSPSLKITAHGSSTISPKRSPIPRLSPGPSSSVSCPATAASAQCTARPVSSLPRRHAATASSPSSPARFTWTPPCAGNVLRRLPLQIRHRPAPPKSRRRPESRPPSPAGSMTASRSRWPQAAHRRQP